MPYWLLILAAVIGLGAGRIGYIRSQGHARPRRDEYK